jgi:hypothetical protein
VRSGPGEARTILLLHIISVGASKQPLMVRTFLKVMMILYGARLLLFVSARTNKRHHHHPLEQNLLLPRDIVVTMHHRHVHTVQWSSPLTTLHSCEATSCSSP